MNRIKKIIILLAVTLGFVGQVFGQTPTPFGCDEAGMILTAGSGSTTNFYKLNTMVAPMEFSLLFTIPYVINSTGFNPLDGFLYAFPQANTGNTSGQSQMYRIGANGAVEVLPVTIISTTANRPAGGGYKGGTIDNNGIYYLTPAADASAMYFIDLKEATLTTRRVTYTGVSNLPDIAWSPVDNNLYAVDSYTTGSNEGKLVQFIVTRDAAGYPTAISMTRIGARWSYTGTYTDASNYSFGGLYIGAEGILYGSLNVGGFYQFNLTDGTRQRLTSSQGSTANDGAACPNAHLIFASDIQITKTDSKDNVIRGNSTTYTVVVTNAGPYPANNVQISDPLPFGIAATDVSYTAVTTLGAVTAVAAGAHIGAISDVVSLPVGASVTYTVNLTVPANFTGNTLPNTVTATPDPDTTFDPDPSNNTATDINEIRDKAFIPVNPHIRGKLKN